MVDLKLHRTTIFLTTALSKNLDVLSLQTGESRSTIIRMALAEYLKQRGYKPHKEPIVTVRHKQ